MKLTQEQLNFLEEELGVTQKNIAHMSIEEWREVRGQCFDIETDELLALQEEGYSIDEYTTDREELASSIASIDYKDLFK